MNWEFLEKMKAKVLRKKNRNMEYKFESTGNLELDKIIKKFDKQIRNEYKYSKGKKYKCISYWSKNILLESINFTLNDWKQVRTREYWEKRDNLQIILNNLKSNDYQVKEIELKQKELLYNSIIKYKYK